MHFMR